MKLYEEEQKARSITLYWVLGIGVVAVFLFWGSSNNKQTAPPTPTPDFSNVKAYDQYGPQETQFAIDTYEDKMALTSDYIENKLKQEGDPGYLTAVAPNEIGVSEPVSVAKYPSSCIGGCSVPPPGCDIKGNISFGSQEKIYQIPGQKYYTATIIDPSYGERWFCTEAEAQANGWRKSMQ